MKKQIVIHEAKYQFVPIPFQIWRTVGHRTMQADETIGEQLSFITYPQFSHPITTI
jgi:hypothetical protein